MAHCVICLEDINKEYITECCRQHFCLECINQWLNIKNNCPLCRSIIIKAEKNVNMIEKINTFIQWFIYFFQLSIIILGFIAEYLKK